MSGTAKATSDEAPRKRQYRVDDAFISSMIWRTACALHSALAAKEPGVVLAMRSVAWAAEPNSPQFRLKPMMAANARSAYVAMSSALLPTYWLVVRGVRGVLEEAQVESFHHRSVRPDPYTPHTSASSALRLSFVARRARRT